MGKGEIACYEHFLLYPQCFQKASFPGASKGVILWEWVKLVQFQRICRQQNILYLKIEICFRKGRKHCGKRKKCWLSAFSPFSHNVFKRLFLWCG